MAVLLNVNVVALALSWLAGGIVMCAPSDGDGDCEYCSGQCQ